ncbi:MAG: FHA domain-containing protein [Planctomycetota bacterium]|jgi:class 3 adenylate cyclase
MTTPPLTSYEPPPATREDPLHLVGGRGTAQEEKYPFFDRVEIGRYHENRKGEPGVLLIQDTTVSRRHCVISRSPDGRCFIRELSRNGTWVDGRRLVPNIEAEIQIGQVVRVGEKHCFVLGGEAQEAAESLEDEDISMTINVGGQTMVTVVVGDIRDYTGLVRKADGTMLQESVDRTFQKLEEVVLAHGGSIKEYQGDAIFAYWEGDSPESHAVRACRAALELNLLVGKLAQDSNVWNVEGFPLKMEWALTTGLVVIKNLGGDRPTGISMIGEPVVLAFRIEKLADDSTGPIVACPITKEAAMDSFDFRDLGEVQAKGFDKDTQIFALLGPRKDN